MKRITAFILTMFIISAIPFTAYGSGEAQTGRLLYTDISVYINHYPIPSYAIDDGNMAVKLRDLENYGFTVGWNEENRTATLELGRDKAEITGMPDVELPSQKTGILYAKYIKDDVKVMFHGDEIPVYIANDTSYICVQDLSRVGEVIWCPDLKATKVWIEGLPCTDYVVLSTAKTPDKPIVSDFGNYTGCDNTKKDWWFRKSIGSSEIDSSVVPGLLGHKVIFRDTARPKKIYLTFDEGYEEGYTDQILNTLNKYNIPATFFITGDYLKESPNLVEKMLQYGYTVGNHTMNHPNLPSSSSQNVAYQLSELNNMFAQKFGMNMEYMRPPEGSYSSRVLQMADDMGYKTVFWSFAYSDWDTANQHGADYAFNQITPYLHDGEVMLLHACSSDNTNVLDRLIQYIIDSGYTFGSLDEIWV